MDRDSAVEKELLEVFKLYSYEEIMNDGNQCFVVDVDGLIKTLIHKGYRPGPAKVLSVIELENIIMLQSDLAVEKIRHLAEKINAAQTGETE